MHQKDVAALVNATTSTVTNWEKGRTSPRLCFRPLVFKFLGYIPFSTVTETIGEQIKGYRQKHGLSMKKLARELGIDPSTVARWENEGRMPNRAIQKRLKTLGAITTRKPG